MKLYLKPLGSCHPRYLRKICKLVSVFISKIVTVTFQIGILDCCNFFGHLMLASTLDSFWSDTGLTLYASYFSSKWMPSITYFKNEIVAAVLKKSNYLDWNFSWCCFGIDLRKLNSYHLNYIFLKLLQISLFTYMLLQVTSQFVIKFRGPKFLPWNGWNHSRLIWFLCLLSAHYVTE